MESDTLILQCPGLTCGEVFPVMINGPYRRGATYGMENAPLYAIAEAHEESKRDSIHCIHCGISVYVEVCFTLRTRYLSCREREGTQEWRIA